MSVEKASVLAAIAVAMAGQAAPVRAQDAFAPALPDETVEEASAARPFARGQLSTSGFFYRERSAEVVPGNQQASPEDLAFADFRARLQAGNLAGGRWGGLGDFRLRLTSDELAARGFEGGGEYHLREGYVARRGQRVDLSLGRHIVRDVDAIRVDGAALRLRPRDTRWEYGAFAGLYPNPLSRSLATDYRRESGTRLPAAGGVWAAYNTGRNHGGFGVAGILPRDGALAAEPEPTRVLASSNGYHMVGDRLDLFHYFVADLAGPSGAQLLSLQLGANYRASARLRLEAGFAHMSTYAVELYVRDLLETPDPQPENGAPVQNNLTLVRIASNEGRVGAIFSLPARVALYGQLRVRERDTLLDTELPMEIAALAPDTQLDLSGGVKQRNSVLGLDLTADVVAIRGTRTASTFVSLRARRGLLDGHLDAEVEVGGVDYADRCEDGDPTCTGNLDGRTLRAGGLLVFLPARRWLFLSDYHFAWNTAERTGMEQPAIRSHMLFFRAQRSF